MQRCPARKIHIVTIGKEYSHRSDFAAKVVLILSRSAPRAVPSPCLVLEAPVTETCCLSCGGELGEQTVDDQFVSFPSCTSGRPYLTGANKGFVHLPKTQACLPDRAEFCQARLETRFPL